MRAVTGTQGNARQKRPRRGSRGSTGSIADDFGGLEGLPTLRKLHAIAVWLRNSTIYANYWDDEVNLRLSIDSATRWFSWYIVMENALRKKAQIIQFMTNHEVAVGDNRFIAVIGLVWSGLV
jgi:hypothetical protein